MNPSNKFYPIMVLSCLLIFLLKIGYSNSGPCDPIDPVSLVFEQDTLSNRAIGDAITHDSIADSNPDGSSVIGQYQQMADNSEEVEFSRFITILDNGSWSILILGVLFVVLKFSKFSKKNPLRFLYLFLSQETLSYYAIFLIALPVIIAFQVVFRVTDFWSGVLVESPSQLSV